MKFYQNVQQMIRRIALLLVLAFVGATEGLHAQRFAVSANLPALLTGTISVEPSVALGDRTSLQLSFSAEVGLGRARRDGGLQPSPALLDEGRLQPWLLRLGACSRDGLPLWRGQSLQDVL